MNSGQFLAMPDESLELFPFSGYHGFVFPILVQARQTNGVPGRGVARKLLFLPALHADAFAVYNGMSFMLQNRWHARFLKMISHVRRGHLQSIGNLQLCRAGIPHLAYFFS